MGIRSVFIWGFSISVMCRKIARRFSTLIWVVLGERLAVLVENCLEEGEEPIHKKRVLSSST